LIEMFRKCLRKLALCVLEVKCIQPCEKGRSRSKPGFYQQSKGGCVFIISLIESKGVEREEEILYKEVLQKKEEENITNSAED